MDQSPKPARLSDQEESRPSELGGHQYASFVLRCWRAQLAQDGQPLGDRAGEWRAYLLDARSGVRYPVDDLSDLPALICSLLEA